MRFHDTVLRPMRFHDTKKQKQRLTNKHDCQEQEAVSGRVQSRQYDPCDNAADAEHGQDDEHPPERRHLDEALDARLLAHTPAAVVRTTRAVRPPVSRPPGASRPAAVVMVPVPRLVARPLVRPVTPAVAVPLPVLVGAGRGDGGRGGDVRVQQVGEGVRMVGGDACRNPDVRVASLDLPVRGQVAGSRVTLTRRPTQLAPSCRKVRLSESWVQVSRVSLWRSVMRVCGHRRPGAGVFRVTLHPIAIGRWRHRESDTHRSFQPNITHTQLVNRIVRIDWLKADFVIDNIRVIGQRMSVLRERQTPNRAAWRPTAGVD